jgi:hypothetical protein
MFGFREFVFMEMPITRFDLVGQWGPDAKRNYRYGDQDIKILENPKAVEKIHRSWSNSKNDFELYFVRSWKASGYVERGRESPEWVKENLGLDIPEKEGAITIIFTNNRGDEKIPMTAWAMAHRLSHAVRMDKTFEEHFSKEIDRDFKEILEYVYGVQNKYYQKPWEAPIIEGRMLETYRKALFSAVGKMKSARENNLRNSNEFVHELVAQYIITGKIEFNDLPRRLVVDRRMAWGRPNYKFLNSKDETAYVEYNEMLHSNASKYEYNLDSIFSGFEGKIYVM